MNDLISRDAAMDVIKTWGRQISENARMTLMLRDMQALEPVDAVPVRKGRWIEEDTTHPDFGLSYYFCSECKQFWGTFHKGFKLNKIYEYCPNCGADMREEGETE